MKALLIFNPASGNPAESATQLLELLRQLQTQQFQVEVLVVQPDHRLDEIARGAARSGTFRVGGTADANACRTVRRCTPCLTDNSRIDTSGSSRRSLRIASNTLTRLPTDTPAPPSRRQRRPA